MSRARDFADLAGSADAGGLTGRNMVINGAMQVAQRGTSFTSNGYNVDRWRNDVVNAGAFTVTQSTTVPSGSGFVNSVKWDCTTADASLAASDYLIHSQRIEAQNLQHLAYGTSSAKAVTLSFWVRSNKTGTYWAEIQHSDAGVYSGIRYTINSADTWEFKTLTFDGYQTTAINNDNGIGFFVNWWLAAGTTFTSGTLTENSFHSTNANRLVGQVNLADSTSNEWYVTGCQLEVGEQATPFEHRSFADELARCQRYYSKSYSYDVAPGTVSGAGQEVQRGVTQGGGFTGSTFDFPVAMRTGPTMTFYLSGNANTAGQWNVNYSGGTSAVTATVQDLGTSGCRADITTGIGNWTACQVYGHWVADAEL